MKTDRNPYKIATQVCMLIIVINLLVIFHFIRVSGESMIPLLEDGKYYLTYNIKTKNLQLGDILILKVDNKRIVKLVRGMGGDTYQYVIEGGKSYHYINERPVVDYYPSYTDIKEDSPIEETTLNENEVFVIGANESNSIDSRMFGVVKIGNISRIIRRRPK